jgi:hypothetical protein
MSAVAAPEIPSVVPRRTVIETSFSRKLSRCFWFIGGFDSSILEQPGYSSIRAKYSCMGGLVLLTSLLALYSSGYAIYTVFKQIYWTIPIALTWAAMILFLDRYLVSSTRKTATIEEYYSTLPVPTPYKVRQSWGAALIRMALAMMVGIVVAKPIEIRLMRPIVDDFYREKLATELRTSESSDVRSRMITEFNQVTASIAAKEEELRNLTQETQLELNGQSSSGQPQGDGRLYKIKKTAEDTARGELTQLRERQDAIRTALRGFEIHESERITGSHADRESQRSFISDYQAIKIMEAEKAKGATGVGLLSLFLTMFFILVEMSPVLAKTLSPYDPYDAALQRREHHLILDDLSDARSDHRRAFDAQQP